MLVPASVGGRFGFGRFILMSKCGNIAWLTARELPLPRPVPELWDCACPGMHEDSSRTSVVCARAWIAYRAGTRRAMARARLVQLRAQFLLVPTPALTYTRARSRFDLYVSVRKSASVPVHAQSSVR